MMNRTSVKTKRKKKKKEDKTTNNKTEKRKERVRASEREQKNRCFFPGRDSIFEKQGASEFQVDVITARIQSWRREHILNSASRIVY